MKKILIFIAIIAVVVISCSKSTGTNSSNNTTLDCTGVAQSFAKDVDPIIETTCATNSGCHGSGSSNGPGPLLTYDQIFSSRVAIRSAVSSGTMPLGNTLTTSEKNTILCWIDGGAISN